MGNDVSSTAIIIIVTLNEHKIYNVRTHFLMFSFIQIITHETVAIEIKLPLNLDPLHMPDQKLEDYLHYLRPVFLIESKVVVGGHL